jgi:acyl carrier protein
VQQTIEETIGQFVQETFMIGQSETLAGDTSFLEKGIIDSTGVLELVSFVEQTFGFTIGDEDLTPENLDSINLVTAFIKRKLGSAAMESAA